MASILAYRVKTSKIKDERDLRENEIIDTIKVKTSTRVNWTTLRNMQPVPRWNQPHPVEPGFYLDIIRPTHTSRRIWDLEATYTPFKGGQQDANPLSRPAVISGKSSLIEVPTFFDATGKAIVTRAGEFIPGVMQSIPTLEYTVTKNLAADPGWLQTHLGAINADALRIRGLTWQPKTLMLGAVSFGEFKTEERATYSEYQITLMANPLGWTQELWNVGTVELVEASVYLNGKIRKIWRQSPILQGSPPVPVESPVPLDANGVAIIDVIDPGTGDSYKSGSLVKLRFDTQNILAFRGALPLT